MTGDAKSERIGLWVNAEAGRGEGAELAQRFVAEASSRGHVTILLADHSREAAHVAAKAAMVEGIDRLVIIGGDGTVHQAIQVLAKTPVIMGLIPAGTGNDFTRALGLETDPTKAIDASLSQPWPMDLLLIGEQWGATVATLGFSTAVNRRAESMTWPRGSAKYTAATLLEISNLREHPMRLHLDGQLLEVSPNLIAIANTACFGGGMRIAPDALPDDGLLDLVLVGPTPRTTLLRLLPTVRTGRHTQRPEVSIYRGVKLTIDSDEPLEIRADGEVVGFTPAEIKIVPAALQFAGRKPNRGAVPSNKA